MEFAYDLLKNDGVDAPRHRLEQGADDHRPGGEPGRLQRLPRGRTAGDFSLLDYEMKRKNCRLAVDAAIPQPTCEQQTPSAWRRPEPQLRRPLGWGGASLTSPTTRTGAAPFSEPEIQNIHELVSARQVTTLITNHTYSNLVLARRADRLGLPARRAGVQGAGRAMAAQNGYRTAGFRPLRHDRCHRGLVVLDHRRLRFTFEIGPTGSTRSTRPASRPSTWGSRLRRARGTAATARRTTTMPRRPPTRRALTDQGLRAHRVDAGSRVVPDVTSPVCRRLRDLMRPDPVPGCAELEFGHGARSLEREPVHPPARRRSRGP